MEKRWCSACGKAFEPRPQSPRQAYCTDAGCQRARKRLWQRAKRSTDDDYRANQELAQQVWRRTHPNYWRQYRETHPDYAASNRQQQLQRNARRMSDGGLIANSDASTPQFPAAGVFRLVQLDPVYGRGRREWTVRLTFLGAS